VTLQPVPDPTGEHAGSRTQDLAPSHDLHASGLRAEALRPDDFEAQLGLGRAAARAGDREAAIRHLDRALQIRPGNQAAVLERSRL